MAVQRADIAILGGGLAGGLVALALARECPLLDVVVIEQDERLGGNHLWSFFGADIPAEGLSLIAPLVEADWADYEVRFPGYERVLDTSYHAMTSARLDSTLRLVLPPESVLTGSRIASATAREIMLANGRQISARFVLDCRGARNLNQLSGGWQKFLGQRLKLIRPHGLTHPIVMDATVEQIDGYRFVYCLPFGPDEVFVEDTYYSEDPTLDRAVLAARINAYAQSRGWQTIGVTGEEQGVLPVVAGGDFTAFQAGGLARPTPAGVRGGLFHPLTSYSLPDALRFALAFADHARNGVDGLHQMSVKWGARHWQRMRYYRLLSAMLFAAAEPGERYRVLERFYRLDPHLIERFYAGNSTAGDKLRILAGRPPVPIMRALGVISGFGRSPERLRDFAATD